MLRATVEIDQYSDLDSTLDALRQRARQAQLPDASQALLEEQTRIAVEPLITRGRQLAALGSQMHVTRRIDGDDYSVAVVCDVGKRPSNAGRLLRRLRWW